MWVAYVIGVIGVIAASALELRSRLRAPWTFRDGAWAWWLLRVGVDGITGAIAVWLLADEAQVDLPPIVLGLAAAGGATSLLRQSFANVDGTPIGFKFFYDLVRAASDPEIEGAGAARFNSWKFDVLMPALASAGISAKEVGQRLSGYVTLIGSLADQAEVLGQISKILKDAVTEEDKIDALVSKAVELRAFKMLRDLERYAREKRPPG